MLRLIIIVPFLAILVIFLLLNGEPVQMSFALIEGKASIGIIVFLVGIVSFLIGALTVFISVVKQWRRTRKVKQQVQELERKLNDLREQYINNLAQPPVVGTHIVTPAPVTTIAPSAEEHAEELTLSK